MGNDEKGKILILHSIGCNALRDNDESSCNCGPYDTSPRTHEHSWWSPTPWMPWEICVGCKIERQKQKLKDTGE